MLAPCTIALTCLFMTFVCCLNSTCWTKSIHWHIHILPEKNGLGWQIKSEWLHSVPILPGSQVSDELRALEQEEMQKVNHNTNYFENPIFHQSKKKHRFLWNEEHIVMDHFDASRPRLQYHTACKRLILYLFDLNYSKESKTFYFFH